MPIDTWRGLRNFLVVIPRIRDVPGNRLEVTENFTLRVGLQNNAPWRANTPRIVFRNLEVTVAATDFASPTAGPVVTQGFNDADIAMTEGTISDIPMVANQTLPWLQDIFLREEVAQITVTAEVDWQQYFQITRFVTVNREIDRFSGRDN